MPKLFQPVPERIVLTGFMGAGKSTVGRLLAERLGWRFADLDTVVETRTGRSVPDIFATAGEAAFRLAETQALGNLLRGTRLIVALGGGALGSPELRTLLENATNIAVVHLSASFPVLYDRCRKQALDPAATARPLLRDRAAAEARYLQRLPLYGAAAHLEVEVGADTPEIAVDRLCARLALLRQ